MKKNYLLICLIALFYINSGAQDTQGFFLNDWQPKRIASPSFVNTTQEAIGKTLIALNVNFTDTVAKVSKYVYGNNGNPWSGRMNTDATLLEYLNDLNPHVIRWPGGNLSQVYFWDRSTSPSDIPDTVAQQFSGGVGSGQSNDDFYDLLKKTNSTGSVCVNIAYARYGTSANPIPNAAHYAANWVRYDKGRSKFWELGNENYGSWEMGYKIDTSLNKDHQPILISGTLYGQICSVFIDSMRAAAAETGADIKIGAVAVEQSVTYDAIQLNWDKGMMAQIANKADYYIVHSYYTPYKENSTVATILNSPSETKGFVNFITSSLAAVKHGPMPVALTEWNIFAQGSMQDVSYINGMQSAINVGELIKNKYGMAAKWDLSNGWGGTGDDMGMFAASDESDVTYRTPHPQFHYMYFFQKCFGDQMVNSAVTGNSNIVGYASSFSSGHCGVMLANKSNVGQQISVNIKNFNKGKHFYIYTLTGGTDNGNFSRKVFINGQGPTEVAGGPANYATIKPYGLVTDDSIKFSMPPLSVVYAIIDPKKVPDVEWAEVISNPNIVNVKLTNAVVIPDSVTGLKAMVNGKTDSITKVERDASDSSLLLITVNKAIVNTDTVVISYVGGNLKTWDSVSMVENPAIKVQNLLKGSAPQILDASTDSAGTSIIIHFNKKMDAASTNSFKITVTYLNNQTDTISAISFYKGDSTTYSLTTANPLYFYYRITLSYSGSDVMSSDEGKLAAIDSLLVKNYSPLTPSGIQQVNTSTNGATVEIYPNPVKDVLTINTSFLYNNIEIVDLTGKQVFSKESPLGFSETNNIKLQLSKGLYFLVLRGKTQKITSKLVVN